jgi:GT2 family glycosyltransferase
VLVLNYNGRALLEECLPSVLAAAEASQHACRVIVVDNDSSDGSAEFLARSFPRVEVVARPNRGLCSFNDVLAGLSCPVAVLLNNDIKLDEACIDQLIKPLLRPPGKAETAPGDHQRPRCFMTAPRCWLFDGATYEGLKTAVRWRWGVVQATALFPGHTAVIDVPGPTASAGAALAVDRRVFLELGGFDPLYLPGRIEDLDFAFRGYLAGYQALYVPAAVAYHRGMATFGPAFSPRGCDDLALRNTLLFQWKNLRHPEHLLRQLVGLPLRVLRDLATAPFRPRDRRLATCRALAAAWRRRREIRRGPRPAGTMAREAAFFRAHHPRALIRAGKTWMTDDDQAAGLWNLNERLRDRRHPISRWYLLPLAGWLARRLAGSSLRPWHVTLAGAGFAVLAALCLGLGWGTMAAGLILAAWACDRLDGKLARRQQSETRWGAWLDANLDELTDLGLHAALACAAAASTQSSLPWALFTAFLFGKYLFVYGLASDAHAAVCNAEAETPSALIPHSAFRIPHSTYASLRRLYHLPGNADVRVHMLALLTMAGWWTAELLLVAAYFNARWIARYALVTGRQGGPLVPGVQEGRVHSHASPATGARSRARERGDSSTSTNQSTVTSPRELSPVA